MTANKRSPVMPDVPTTDEAGLPGFHFYFWHALWVPKGTPKDVIAKLNDATGEGAGTIRRPASGCSTSGRSSIRPDMSSPEALGKFQKAEIEKWWPIIKAAGIKAAMRDETMKTNQK